MRLAVILGSAVVAMIVATGGAAGGSLASMTVQLSDLPTGYTQTKSSVCSRSCVKKTQGSVPAGYVTGWQRDYDAGTKEILSAVSLYSSASAARVSIRSSWQAAERHGCKRVSMAERVGDEARLYVCKHRGVSVYALAWGSRKLKASLVLAGYVVGGDLAARLAVKQQARMGR